MPLLLSSLLESTSPDEEQEVVRVLHINRDSDCVRVIRIDRSDALPEARRLSEVEAALSEHRMRMLTADPFDYLQMPEETIAEKHRRRRDAAWAIIESIVTAPGQAALEPDSRGQLVRTAREASCTSACRAKVP